MKTTNASGEIRTANDIWPVAPVVTGEGLAAVEAFADAIQERFGLSDGEREAVARRWWYQDDAGRTYSFVPSRGIHDRSGGTTSTGDTIDSTTLIYSRTEPGRQTLRHPSDFA